MAEAPLADLVSTQPQYVLVAQALMDDIRRGRYAVGDLLPPELMLCTQFGVSRHTIREAMRLLTERGLVTRQRGVGTLVAANEVPTHYVQSTMSITDLPQYVDETRLVTQSCSDVLADDGLATLLDCPPGQRWLHIVGLRFVGRSKEPIALTRIYINAAYAGVQDQVGKQKVPVYTLIEQRYGVAVVEVRQCIAATLVGDDDARALRVEPGTAGLVVTRHYYGHQRRLIEVAVNLHPADRFEYSMSLRMQPRAV